MKSFEKAGKAILCLAIAAMVALTMFFTITADAQSTGGRIRGTVVDPSGGAVVGAKVLLLNEANGTQRDTQASATGEYIFLEVPVGNYQVQVNHPGFKKYLRKGIVVNLNEVVNLDIPLVVGGATQTEEITREPPLAD